MARTPGYALGQEGRNLVTRCNDVVLYDLCLTYHSNTEAIILFACRSSGRVTTTGRLLGIFDMYKYFKAERLDELHTLLQPQ